MDGSALETNMLHSFIIIPPDICTDDLVDLVAETLRQAGIYVDQVFCFSGEDIHLYGTQFRRHYAALHHYAMARSNDVVKEAICSTREVHSRFFLLFKELWEKVVEEGRLLTARDMLVDRGGSAGDPASCLPRRCDPATRKLFDGFFITPLDGDFSGVGVSKPTYVINGFFPALLKSLEASDCVCGGLTVSWPQHLYSYAQFRSKVMGENELSAAVQSCLKQGNLTAKKGSGCQALCWKDIVEVASGPLELMMWRRIWLDEDLVEDERSRELLQQGVSRDFIEKMLENPILVLPSGPVASIFELFANLESLEVLAGRLQELRTRLEQMGEAALKEKEEKRVAKQDERSAPDSKMVHSTTSMKAGVSVAPTLFGVTENRLWLFKQCSGSPIFTLKELGGMEDAPARNTALLLIKPSAHTPFALRAIWQCLVAHDITGLRVEDETDINASQIEANHLMDRHYRTIAHYAGRCAASQIPLQAAAQGMFEQEYHLSWLEALEFGVVWPATKLLQFLTWLTPRDLYELWNAQPRKMKLVSGAYIAQISFGPADDATSYYVVNGFYPYLRELFVSPGAQTRCYLISWPETALSWSRFRTDIVGCTDPSKAPPSSLRGMLYRSWADLGLSRQPSSIENGVHASASALEGIVEQHLWFGTPLDQSGCTGFMQRQLGLSPAPWLSWAFNPRIPVDGGVRVANVFDVMENQNTRQFLLASSVEEAHQLRHYETEHTNRAILVLHPSPALGPLVEHLPSVLSQYHVTIEEEGDAYGKDAASRVLDMPTLRAIAHLASLRGRELVRYLSVSTRRRFYERFHTHIQHTKDELLGAEVACTTLGLSALDLFQACTKAGLEHLCSSCHISFLSKQHCFVVNGEYPYLRERYANTVDCRAHYYRLSWKENHTSWESLYAFVMGGMGLSSAARGEGHRPSNSPAEPVSLWEVLSRTMPAYRDVGREEQEEEQEPEKSELDSAAPEVFWYLSAGPLQAVGDGLSWALPRVKDDALGLRLLQEPLPQWLMMRGVSPYIVSHFSLLKADSTAMEQEIVEHVSTGQNTSMCVHLTRAVASNFSRMVTQHFGFLWLPPLTSSCGFAEDVPGLLRAHGVRVLDYGRLFLGDGLQNQALNRPYSKFHQNACERAAHDVILSTAAKATFRDVFGLDWSVALELSLVLNAKEAAKRYGEDCVVRSWQHESSRKACLCEGLSVCYMEKEGIYVMNASYLETRSQLLYGGDHAAWYSVCWKADLMDWHAFLQKVVGIGGDQTSSELSSLRGYLSSHWQDYGLMESTSDSTPPGLYVSSTAMEAIAERCLWLKIPPEEDVFGRWLVWHGVEPSFLQSALLNPVVRLSNAADAADMHLFDTLPSGVDCTAPMDLLHALLAYQRRPTFQLLAPRNRGTLDLFKVPLSDADGSAHSKQVSPATVAHAVLTLNPCLLAAPKDYATVRALLEHHLQEHRIEVVAAGALPPHEAERRQVFCAQHPRLFYYAMRLEPRELPHCLPETARAELEELLRTDDRNAGDKGGNPDATASFPNNELRLLSAVQFAKDYGLTTKALRLTWDRCTTVIRLDDGCYVGKVSGEHVCVVNGFVPHQMELTSLFATPFLLVRFDESHLSYEAMCARVIGSPAAPLQSVQAAPSQASFHELLRASWRRFGLSAPPDRFFGLVHASNSAAAALAFRRCFLPYPPSLAVDPFGQLCRCQLKLPAYVVGLAASATSRAPPEELFGGETLAGKGVAGTVALLRRAVLACTTAPVRNTALVLIQPEALGRCVLRVVEDTFSAWGLRVEAEGDVPGPIACEKRLVRLFLPEAVGYAVGDPTAIELSAPEAAEIENVFGQSWFKLTQSGLVWNAYVALERLGGWSAARLLGCWRESARDRVVLRGGALEVMALAEAGAYVVNAFLPAFRQGMESEMVLTHWFVVSWPETALSWGRFRREVVGEAADPAAALPTSIRGRVFRDWARLGLARPPDRIFNVVHASADAWRGLVERLVVVQPRVAEDPLGHALLSSGVHPGLLSYWRQHAPLLAHAIRGWIRWEETSTGTTAPTASADSSSLECGLDSTSSLIHCLRELSSHICACAREQKAAAGDAETVSHFNSDYTSEAEAQRAGHQDGADSGSIDSNLTTNEVVEVFLGILENCGMAMSEAEKISAVEQIGSGAVAEAVASSLCSGESTKKCRKLRGHLQQALNYAQGLLKG